MRRNSRSLLVTQRQAKLKTVGGDPEIVVADDLALPPQVKSHPAVLFSHLGIEAEGRDCLYKGVEQLQSDRGVCSVLCAKSKFTVSYGRDHPIAGRLPKHMVGHAGLGLLE
jgi:hypothetical protein